MTEAGATLQDFGGAFAPSSGGALPDGLAEIDLGSMAGETGSASPEKLAAAAEQLASALDASTAASELVLVASASPDGATEAAGDHLGALVMATGNPQDLAAAIRAGGAEGPLRTLTSDSTRRDGVVAAPDLAQTAVDFVGHRGVNDPGGER